MSNQGCVGLPLEGEGAGQAGLSVMHGLPAADDMRSFLASIRPCQHVLVTWPVSSAYTCTHQSAIQQSRRAQ